MANYVKLTANSPIVNEGGSPHVTLTCQNHPTLRWTCKNIAVGPDENGDIRYNGMRHLFFRGETGNVDSPTSHRVQECSCSSAMLIGIDDSGESNAIAVTKEAA